MRPSTFLLAVLLIAAIGCKKGETPAKLEPAQKAAEPKKAEPKKAEPKKAEPARKSEPVAAKAAPPVPEHWKLLADKTFANAALEGSFRYEDKDAMLKYGSIVFGMMLLPSFPIFYLLDEKKERRFSLGQAAAAGLAASWLGLFLTDLCTHVVGTL